ncbi:MAG: septal ring lytic transglycosylase RlpA family protein [Marinilabiliaceae bacterium]
MHKSRRLLFILFLIVATVLIFDEKTGEPDYYETGEASYYALSLQGRVTASGEPFHHDSLTAAHQTLPLGTRLMVVNLENQRSVIVRVNDRGPFAKDRILDLSRAAFKELAPLEEGVIRVGIVRMESN